VARYCHLVAELYYISCRLNAVKSLEMGLKHGHDKYIPSVSICLLFFASRSIRRLQGCNKGWQKQFADSTEEKALDVQLYKLVQITVEFKREDNSYNSGLLPSISSLVDYPRVGGIRRP
jgi:hypothetical protein